MKKLKCHCGAVEAEINIENFEKVMRCNCSLCKRKGAIMAIVDNDKFKIIRGNDKLKIYQFHTNVAKHFFCSVCGIYTHHHPRINTALTGFNIGCLDEINQFDIKNIKLADGNNHPLDKK